MSERRGPASGPEPGPEPVSVPVAALTLGISERAIRKRIHAGTLRAEPFGRSFKVYLPADAPEPVPEPGPVQGPEPGPRGPEPIKAAHRVTPAEVQRAIEATGARYVADFATLYDRISAEVGRLYEGQLAAKDETIAELRRRAEVAEAELGAARVALDVTVHGQAEALAEVASLRTRPSAPVVARDEPEGDRRTPEASDAESGAGEGLWARVRRWWTQET